MEKEEGKFQKTWELEKGRKGKEGKGEEKEEGVKGDEWERGKGNIKEGGRGKWKIVGSKEKSTGGREEEMEPEERKKVSVKK